MDSEEIVNLFVDWIVFVVVFCLIPIFMFKKKKVNKPVKNDDINAVKKDIAAGVVMLMRKMKMARLCLCLRRRKGAQKQCPRS